MDLLIRFSYPWIPCFLSFLCMLFFINLCICLSLLFLMYCSLISLLIFGVYYYRFFFSYHSDGWNQQIQFQSCATSNAGSLQYLDCILSARSFFQKSVTENLFFLQTTIIVSRYCSSSSSCSATGGGGGGGGSSSSSSSSSSSFTKTSAKWYRKSCHIFIYIYIFLFLYYFIWYFHMYHIYIKSCYSWDLSSKCRYLTKNESIAIHPWKISDSVFLALSCFSQHTPLANHQTNLGSSSVYPVWIPLLSEGTLGEKNQHWIASCAYLQVPLVALCV